MMGSLRSTTAMFLKDFRSELRTRYALTALMLFVITTLSIILFSIGNESVSPEILSGVLWIIVFFSAMSGLSRTFVSEEERGTVLTLQLLAKPLTVFFGKLLFNFALLASLNTVAGTLYIILINDFVVKNYAIFLLTMLLGTLGLSAASTIIAAVVSKANTKGTLYPVMAFPILLPLLLTVISATRLAVEGAPFSEAAGEFRVLFSYFVVIVAVSYLVFEFIWKD
ncbi:MAG TPA: heme exporter protein CcmB [Bacteroidota bacterium]|jgi:heme exporter protein B|nr:heme exporter protein CcmB [Bacteroidota bacterium]